MAQTRTSIPEAVEGTRRVPRVVAPTPGQMVLRQLSSNRMALVAMVVLIVIHLTALLAPYIVPHDPDRISLVERLRPPTREHLLGTDETGRDILSRLLYGSRVSLAVGLTAMVFSVALGTLLGGVAGYAGGRIDALVMRATDGMLSIPLFFFMLTALSLLGSSLINIVIVIGLASWMTVARVVRAEVLRTMPQEYVVASRAIGANDGRILFRHVLPQAVPSIIVGATLVVAYSILMESALSFLGLGVQPPAASWGNMLSNARGYMWTAPLLAVYPGAMIFLTVLLYNWLGDGLRDALDPTAGQAR